MCVFVSFATCMYNVCAVCLCIYDACATVFIHFIAYGLCVPEYKVCFQLCSVWCVYGVSILVFVYFMSVLQYTVIVANYPDIFVFSLNPPNIVSWGL